MCWMGSSSISVAVIKYSDHEHLWEERIYLAYTSRSLSIIEGKETRSETEAGTMEVSGGCLTHRLMFSCPVRPREWCCPQWAASHISYQSGQPPQTCPQVSVIWASLRLKLPSQLTELCQARPVGPNHFIVPFPLSKTKDSSHECTSVCDVGAGVYSVITVFLFPEHSWKLKIFANWVFLSGHCQLTMSLLNFNNVDLIKQKPKNPTNQPNKQKPKKPYKEGLTGKETLFWYVCCPLLDRNK